MSIKDDYHFIGQGGFGKVYQIEHPHDSSRRALKKIWKRKQVYRSELPRLLEINAVLNRLDPHRQFFGGAILQHTDQQLVMQMGGKSLDKILDHDTEMNQDMVRDLFVHFPNLLEGLRILYDQKWIHGDIKASNIVRDPATGDLRFIDYDYFGSQEQYHTARLKNKLFPEMSRSHFYFAWPWERWYQPYTRQFQWNPHEFKRGLYQLQRIGLFSDRKQVHDTIRLFEMLHHPHLTINPELPGWVRKYADYYRSNPTIIDDVMKIDIYSLGLVAYECFFSQRRYRFLADGTQPQKLFHDILTPVLQKMLNPDPHRRAPPSTILREWRRILD